MTFVRIDRIYNNWKVKVPVGTTLTLTRHKVSLNPIIGSPGNHLLVHTKQGVYLYMGETNESEPATQLIAMLSNAEIEMPGPVRVTALDLINL